ncbi:class II aldolase/adducin family protein [Streptomyces sp. NPDC007084]|uniref:class II aldolase/adducin family protein n=1 Tax=Streptomyces sp. NPDC007084 TaxID=3154313 RepID=UPI003451E72A
MQDELVVAAHTLARHGLVTAFGHVSRRVANTVTITSPAALGTITVNDLREIDLGVDSLPTDVPPEAWVHLEIYRKRPDVRAIARAMPPSAFAAAAVTREVPALHGQACWLGAGLPVHPVPLLLRTPQLAHAAATTLGTGSAILLRGNGAVTVGDSPGLAVARMWLVEARCDTWLRATATGSPQTLSAEEVSAWQAPAGTLLPRLWDHLRAAPAQQ